MTSSDRIVTVLQHKEPDRVPMHINASQWELSEGLGIRGIVAIKISL